MKCTDNIAQLLEKRTNTVLYQYNETNISPTDHFKGLQLILQQPAIEVVFDAGNDSEIVRTIEFGQDWIFDFYVLHDLAGYNQCLPYEAEAN